MSDPLYRRIIPDDTQQQIQQMHLLIEDTITQRTTYALESILVDTIEGELPIENLAAFITAKTSEFPETILTQYGAKHTLFDFVMNIKDYCQIRFGDSAFFQENFGGFADLFEVAFDASRRESELASTANTFVNILTQAVNTLQIFMFATNPKLISDTITAVTRMISNWRQELDLATQTRLTSNGKPVTATWSEYRNRDISNAEELIRWLEDITSKVILQTMLAEQDTEQ